MFYETYGEFEVPYQQTKNSKGKNLVFSKEVLDEFWENVNQHFPNQRLSEARGCYIFAIRAGKGIKPWYVGQSKVPFEKECFAFHKRDIYRTVSDRTRKGTPVLILVARHTPKGKLSKTLPENEADFIEQFLISRALSKNPDLENIKNTNFSKKIQIRGALNNPKGKLSPGALLLRRTLGRKSSSPKS